MQGDGNLVLYRLFDNKAIWASNTAGNPGSRVAMQTDGNLVVYSAANKALWSSRTAGNSGAYLVMQDDANAVVYSAAAKALWASNTAQKNCNSSNWWLSGKNSWSYKWVGIPGSGFAVYDFNFDATSSTFYGDSQGACSVPLVVDKLELNGRTYSESIADPVLIVNKTVYNTSYVKDSDSASMGEGGSDLGKMCGAYVTHRATKNGAVWTSISRDGCAGNPGVY